MESCDIIYEILSRLPVKSVLRFRSVCKSWNSIISNSHFIKSHSQRATESNYPHKLLMFKLNDRGKLQFRSADYKTFDRGWEKFEFRPPSKNTTIEFLCSYHGLILLGVKPNPTPPDQPPFRQLEAKPKLPTENTFILWNPSIREYKSFSCSFVYDSSVAFGICYDLLVVTLLVSNRGIDVLVCDVKNKSSSIVSHPFHYKLLSERGVIVNGMLHWFTRMRDSCFVIVYYDLVESEFKELALPAGYDNDWQGKCFDLEVWRGQLCIYDNCTKPTEAKIWVMKEYGKKESWTCLMVLTTSIGSFEFRILTFTTKGEVVLKVLDIGIVIYSPSEGTFKSVLPITDSVWSLTTHMESLVLLDSW